MCTDNGTRYSNASSMLADCMCCLILAILFCIVFFGKENMCCHSDPVAGTYITIPIHFELIRILFTRESGLGADAVQHEVEYVFRTCDPQAIFTPIWNLLRTPSHRCIEKLCSSKSVRGWERWLTRSLCIAICA